MSISNQIPSKELEITPTEKIKLSGGVNSYTYKTGGTTEAIHHRLIAKKQYEIKDHLGNVRAVVSDVKVPTVDGTGAITDLTADIVSATDYYPFGMQMPGRNFSSNAYRYGFGGQEKIDEIYGSGNYLDYTFRGYNTRIARFFAVDPIDHLYPELTPYQHSSLNPIWNLEIEGLEGKKFQSLKFRKKPRITNDPSGTRLLDRLLGISLRAKHTKNIVHHKNNKPKAKQIEVDLIDVDVKPDFTKTGRKFDNFNPLERISDRGDRVDLRPRYKEGNIKVEFTPEVDNNGAPVPLTVTLGVVDKDGKERVLKSITSNREGNVNFKLKSGETIFKKQTSGEAKTSSTRTVPEDKQEKKK